LARGGLIVRFFQMFQGKQNAITSFIDISNSKALQIEIEESRDIAEAATRAKSDFLARMSHEIRTPMNAIIGMTHLTLKTELEKKQRDNLKKVHSSGVSLLGIINDILDFSKIEAGKLELEHAEFDLEKVFYDFANIITYKAHEKGLELVIGLPHTVPHILIGDSLRLSQLLINLSNNAIKFTEEGEIVIQAKLAEKKKDRVKLLFSVTDTGIGLTKEQAGKLFQSFSQADVSTTRKYGGTGLGLSICKSLSEMMEGEIWVESKKGQGSTFFFTAWFGLGEQQKTKEFKPAVDLRGMKVLVCDDNETSRQILTEALEAFSFKVTTVNSGKEAIVKIENETDKPYELVLMDWNMPGMDGIEATKNINSDVKNQAPPTIIMVTAYNREEVLSETEKVGIAATLIKPVSYSTLFDTIMEVFGKKVIRKAERNDGISLEDLSRKLDGSLVLLVEDNEVNQDVATGMLEAAGIVAEIANNGQEAVEMVKSSGKPSKYKLVFMDLQMPLMDGYTATREIRKLKDYKDLPIAAMTADVISGIKEKCMEAGMNDFVPKPIDPEELARALKTWINPGTSKSGVPEAAKNAKSIADIQDEIPDIIGVDSKAGLQRINNNRKLFLRLLGKFSKNYAAFVPELKNCLEAGKDEETKRMVHTLKGVSGNIGAMKLHEFTIILDDKLKKQEKIDTDSELKALDDLLAPILDSLVKVFKTDSIADTAGQDTVEGDLDTVAFKKLLKELSALLSDGDIESAKRVEELEQVPGTGKYAAMIQSLKNLISDYEFDEAATVVEQLIQSS
jgi:two-component system, sensor histidine kinase and response regulator